MKTGIIVLSWNSRHFISQCLDGLILHEHAPIYVVDNGSVDGSPELIENNYPSVKLIRSEYNLGFAGGNNLGARYAFSDNCDSVFLLNNDTIIDEPFLAPCQTLMEQDSNIGVIGPVVVDGSRPDIIQCQGGFIHPIRLDFPYRNAGKPFIRDSSIIDVGYVLGAAMLIRRSVYESMHGLDPEFFPAYIEEADFCFRASRAGHRICITNNCRVRHIGEKSSGGQGNAFRRLTVNRFRFAIKHLHGLAFLISCQILFLRAAYHKILRKVQ